MPEAPQNALAILVMRYILISSLIQLPPVPIEHPGFFSNPFMPEAPQNALAILVMRYILISSLIQLPPVPIEHPGFFSNPFMPIVPQKCPDYIGDDISWSATLFNYQLYLQNTKAFLLTHSCL